MANKEPHHMAAMIFYHHGNEMLCAVVRTEGSKSVHFLSLSTDSIAIKELTDITSRNVIKLFTYTAERLLSLFGAFPTSCISYAATSKRSSLKKIV